MDIVLIAQYEAVIADLEAGPPEQVIAAKVLRKRVDELYEWSN